MRSFDEGCRELAQKVGHGKLRACSTCKVEKSEADFGRKARGPGGLNSQCRACCAKVRADYHARNREKSHAQNAAWRAENREYDRQRWQTYSARRWGRQWAAHRARIAAQRASSTKLCNACGEEQPKAAFYRCSTRPGEGLFHVCKACFNRLSEPSRMAYKARKRGATVEQVDLGAVLEEHGMHCHICNGGIADGDLHFDHVVPLSRGGTHSAANLKPAHARCNLRKHDRLMEELPDGLVR